ncbi:MAG: hypothetical protein ACOX1Y_08525 [Zhaonellaceae bacterium]|jgi:hypothetical protein|nr:hypothetical protein [Clostridia bacterium]
MKKKIAALLVLGILFAIGFWSWNWINSSADSYEAGSRRNPLASKSYLEEKVEDKFYRLEKEVKRLSDRVDTLLRILPE